ncbi:MAG TPA: YciI family protein [Bacteroidota bacterium]|nr:YciI family protein [Bacteroidota bacterium]
MKYMCLGYFDKKKMDALPKAELDALMGKCQQVIVELYESGHLIIDAGVDQKSTIVRNVKGKVSVTDGPYIETKEQIGGAFIIEAKDEQEAIRIASLHPAVRMGEDRGWALEIRQVTVFEQR